MTYALYQWEMELADHRIIRQYNEDGSENPSTMIPVDEVVRASILPRVGLLPRHDILLDRERGERFVRRFGRGIMKDSGEGFKQAEYLQVIVTTHYRLWVFSSTGNSLVANPDLEVYP
jgi:hypothetical protein